MNTEIEMLEIQAVEAGMALNRAINRQELTEAMSEANVSANDVEKLVLTLYSLIKLTDMSMPEFFMAAAEVIEKNGACNRSVWSGEQLSDFFRWL
jgi:hypothetical protein